MALDSGFAPPPDPAEEARRRAHAKIMAMGGPPDQSVSEATLYPPPDTASVSTPAPANPSPAASPPIIPESTTQPPPTGQPKRYAESAIPDYPGPTAQPPQVTPRVTPKETADVALDAHAALMGEFQADPNLFARTVGMPQQQGIPQPKGDQDASWPRHALHAVEQRAGQLGSDILNGLARSFEPVDPSSTIPNFSTPLSLPAAAGDLVMAQAAKLMGRDKSATIASVLRGFADKSAEIMSETYVPRHNIEDAWTKFVTTGNPTELGYLALEQFPTVLVDAVAAKTAPKLYFAALTEEFARQRAVADGRDPDKTTSGDYLVGAPTAAIAFMIDRHLGEGKTAGFISSGLAKIFNRVKDEAPSSALRRIATVGIEGFFTEMASGSLEQAATTIGTKQGASARDILLSGLAEGLAGGPAGAVAGIWHGDGKHDPNADARNGVGDDATAALGAVEPPAQETAIPEAPPKAPPLLLPPPTANEPVAGAFDNTPSTAVQAQHPSHGSGAIPLPGPGAGLLTGIPSEELPLPPTGEDAPTGEQLAAATGQDLGISVPGAEGADADRVKADTQSPTFQKDYPPEVISQMQAERDAKKSAAETKGSLEQIASKLGAALRANPKAAANTAPAKMLGLLNKGVEEPVENQDPTKPRGLNTQTQTRVVLRTRERVIQAFTNFSDAARILAETYGKTPFRADRKASANATKLAARLEDAAVRLSQARVMVQSLSNADLYSPPVEDVQAMLGSPQIRGDILMLFGSEAADNYDKALNSNDGGQLLAAFNTLNNHAKSIVQRYESKGSNLNESRAIRRDVDAEGKPTEFQGRGKRPDLPEAATRTKADKAEMEGLLVPAAEQKAIRDRIDRDIAEAKKEHADLQKEMQRATVAEKVNPPRIDRLTNKGRKTGPILYQLTPKETPKEIGERRQAEQRRKAALQKQIDAIDARIKNLNEDIAAAAKVEWKSPKVVADIKKTIKELRAERKDLTQQTNRAELQREMQARSKQVIEKQIAQVQERIKELQGQKARLPSANVIAREMQAEAEVSNRRDKHNDLGAAKKVTHRDLYADEQGKVPKELDEESRQERAALRREEETMDDRRLKGYDVEQEAAHGTPSNLSDETKADRKAKRVIDEEAVRLKREQDARDKAKEAFDRQSRDKEYLLELRKQRAKDKDAADAEKAAIKLAAERALLRETPEEKEAREALEAKEVAKEKVIKEEREANKWRDAQTLWSRFKAHVAAGLKQGDVLGMEAFAQDIWDSRSKYKPDRGYLVVDPTAEPGSLYPYRRVHGVIPKLADPNQPGRLRNAPFEVRDPKTEKLVLAYNPEQMEPAIGWHQGPEWRDASGDVRGDLKPFAKNQNLFSPFARDELIRMVEDAKVGQSLREAQQVADYLIKQAEEANQTNRSGTRGYNKGNRAVPREPKTVTSVKGKLVGGKLVPIDQVIPVRSFRTSKGSTYLIDEKGRTTRNKAARPEHPGDEGPQRRSDQTFYLTAEAAQALAPPTESTWRVVVHGPNTVRPGTLSLTTQLPNGEWGIAPSQKNISASTIPTIGSHPLELWDKEYIYNLPAYKMAHFGNPIIDTNPTGEQPPVDTIDPTTETPPVDETPPAEILDEAIDEIRRIIENAFGNGSPDEQRTNYNSWLVNQQRAIDRIRDELIRAEALRDQIADELKTTEITTNDDGNKQLYYKFPVLWPSAKPWFQDTVVVAGGDVVETDAGTQVPYADDTAFATAIMQDVDEAIDNANKLLTRLERELQEKKEQYAAYTSEDKPKRPIGSVTPGGAQASAGPEHAGVSGGDRPEQRPLVDLLSGYGPRAQLVQDPFLDRFRKAPNDQRPVDWGLSDDQYYTAAQIVQTFKQRMAFIKQHGREFVNKAGFLVMSGTGTGKTRIIGAAAKALHALSNKPVLVVLKPGQTKAAVDEWKNYLGFALKRTDADIKFIDYPTLSKRILGSYSAVFYDEAHSIKGSGSNQLWARNADNIDTDFHVFLTATPTDKKGQEDYYLKYMFQDDEPRTKAQAVQLIQQNLGTVGVSRNKQKVVDERKYKKALDQMMSAIIYNNAAASYAMNPSSENVVTKLSSADVDEMASAAYHAAGTDEDREYYLEQMKIPAMVKSTVAAIKNGEDVVAVFYRTNAPDSASGAMRTIPPQRFIDELLKKAPELKEKIDTLFGGRLSASEETTKAERFRRSQSRVFVMSDSRGSTGLNLHDKFDNEWTEPTNPKRMLISRTSQSGEVWMQLMGRLDRRDQKTQAKVEFFRVLGNASDKQWVNSIKSKLDLQRAMTGAERASESGELKFSLESTMERNPDFKRKLTDMPRVTLPVDQMVNERLDKGDTKATDLVSDIARSETDLDVAAMAAALKGHAGLEGLTVQHMTPAMVEATGGALGAYDRGAIYINPDAGGMEATTVLHEVAHHLTHRAIDTNPVAKARLLQIMAAVPADVTPGVTGVQTNPHEFVAEAFSNPAFQAALKKVRVAPNQTLWTRFKDFVRRVIGQQGQDISAFDAVMELRLTDPKTIEEIGHGDLSDHLNNLMLKQIAPRDKIQDAVVRASYVSDPGHKLGLSLLTFNQIVQSFGKVATEVRNGTAYNHLKAIYDVMDSRFGYVTEQRNIYSKRVLEPWREWAVAHGHKPVAMQMEAGPAKTKMTQLQAVSELMNISGYAQVHFGKAVDDPANKMLSINRKTPLKPGETRQKTRADVYWERFKHQFDALPAPAKKLYNDLASFFEEQIDLTSVMRAQQWLDTVSQRQDGQSWYNLPANLVRAEVKRISLMTDADLKKESILRDSLEGLKTILQPGRVPGAYFPIKRFGEYVVTMEERMPWKTQAQRDRLMEEHAGAKSVTHADGTNEVVFKSVSRFESQHDAQQFSEILRADNPTADVSDVMVADDTGLIQKAGLNATLIQQFENRLEEMVQKKQIRAESRDAQLKVFVQSMIDLMPEASYANTFRKREGILGASLDIFRSLNSYGSGLAHYKGAALYSTPQRQANRAFQQYIHSLEHMTPDKKAVLNDGGRLARKLHRIHNELAKREALQAEVTSEGKWGQRLNNIGFAYYLTGASYNLINMMQPIMLTQPYLAGRHGQVATTLAMKRAYSQTGGAAFSKLAKTGLSITELRGMFTGQDFDRKNYAILDEMIGRLDPAIAGRPRTRPVSAQDTRHARLLRNLANRNLIEATVAMDMGQGAHQQHIDPKTGKPVTQSKLAYLSDWMRMAPHITEVLNRSVTAVAAFDLEFNKQLKDGVDVATASKIAEDYAAQAINETQFNYQNWNKPRIMQGSDLRRAMLMFKQHPQHVMYYMVSRFIKSSKALTRRARGERLSAAEEIEANESMKQLAYMIGMTVLAAGAIGGVPEPLKWIIGGLSYLFGGDEPFDFELFMQNTMTDWFGPEWGQVAARGLPVLAGMDLSSRVGINQMLLFGSLRTDSEDSFMSDAARIVGGPLASLGERFFVKAPRDLATGHINRFVEDVSPKMIRDIAKAYRLSNEGFSTYNGMVYAGSDSLTPYEYFLTAMGVSPNKTSLMYLSRTAEDQVTKMNEQKGVLMGNAFEAYGDRDAFSRSLRRIDQWNHANPAFTIKMSDLRTSFRTRISRQTKVSDGMLVPKKYQGYAAHLNRFRGLTPGVN